MLQAQCTDASKSSSGRQSASAGRAVQGRIQRRKGWKEAAYALAFLGVVFFVVALAAAAFLGAAAFFVGAADSGALVLVTRPDFVLPRTRETSFSTAGAAAAAAAAADLRGLLAFALGLAAAAVFLVAAGLAAAAFLVAGAFSFLVVVFAFY